jgi:hypothetical protein
VTFFARHIPGFASGLSIILCAFLIFAGHRTAFHRALAIPSRPYNSAQISPLITAYHTHPNRPGLIHSLSATLAPRQPIRRLMFALHLTFTPPEKRTTAYLYHTQFGSVRSLERAALYYFGIHHTKLAVGEILLLCDLAQGAALPIDNPLAAIKRRDTLLTDLHNRGHLSSTVYQTEHNRALSLSADHKPVN